MVAPFASFRAVSHGASRTASAFTKAGSDASSAPWSSHKDSVGIQVQTPNLHCLRPAPNTYPAPTPALLTASSWLCPFVLFLQVWLNQSRLWDRTSSTATAPRLGTCSLLEIKVHEIRSAAPQWTKRGFCVIPIPHMFPNSHELRTVQSQELMLFSTRSALICSADSRSLQVAWARSSVRSHTSVLGF